MAEWRTIGLTSIEIGAIAGDGGMGTTLAALGKTYQGTAKLQSADPETTDFYAEEDDDPIDKMVKLGARTLTWSIMDFTPATLAAVLGGTASGTGDAATWEAPTSYVDVEKSIKIVTKKNLKIEIPRAKITAKLNVDFGKTAMGLVDITATILTPTKAATAPIKVSKVA